MSNKSRSVTIKTVPTSENRCEIEVTLGYDEGGYNFFCGSENPRGFNLYATVWRTSPEGYRSTILGSGGLKRRVEAATRYNRKRLEKLAAEARDPSSEVARNMEELVENVLKKEGLTRAGALTEIAEASK